MFQTKPDFDIYQDPSQQQYKCLKILYTFSQRVVQENGLIDIKKMLEDGLVIIKRDENDAIVPLKKHIDKVSAEEIYIR